MGGWVLRAGTPAEERWRYEQGQIMGFRFDCAQGQEGSRDRPRANTEILRCAQNDASVGAALRMTRRWVLRSERGAGGLRSG